MKGGGRGLNPLTWLVKKRAYKSNDGVCENQTLELSEVGSLELLSDLLLRYMNDNQLSNISNDCHFNQNTCIYEITIIL